MRIFTHSNFQSMNRAVSTSDHRSGQSSSNDASLATALSSRKPVCDWIPLRRSTADGIDEKKLDIDHGQVISDIFA
jgi:hypothetical protein